MRKLLVLPYLLLIAGFACIAHAQLSQTGAGPKAGGGGGGGFTPCSGTAIHVPDPNNLSTPNWSPTNITRNFTATDPNLVANNATDIVSTLGSGLTIVQTAAAITLTSGVTYQFGGYFKSIVAPTWIAFDADNGTDNIGSWFNISPAATGTAIGSGAGTLSCAQAGAAGNGYTQVSFASTLSLTSTTTILKIFMVNGNGTTASTLNQEINAWQVSP